MSISTYLHWLCREQANANNVAFINIGAMKDGAYKGVTVDALQAIESASDLALEVDAIWASVHCLASTANGKSKITKSDVLAYRYLAIDIDSKTAHGRKVCASDAERAKTKATANRIAVMLQQYGLPQPLTVMSGNGSLLLFPIDLPNTQANQELLGVFADWLKDRFDDADCDIDEAVIKDPSRVLGIVGTINRSKAEVPNEGRYAMERVVVGEYPPNLPISADAFIATINTIMANDSNDSEGSEDSEAITGAGAPQAKGSIERIERINRCKAYLAKCDDAVSGMGGHNATMRAACECYRFGLSDTEAAQVMGWFNLSKCQPSWTDAEIRHKLADAKAEVSAKGQIGNHLGGGNDDTDDKVSTGTAAEDYPMTDLGNAEHFVASHGGHLRYVGSWKCWLVWDGKRWARDDADKVGKMALRHVRRKMPKYAATIKDDERRTKYLRWASQCQSQSKIDAMVSLSSIILACSHDAFDAKPNLFNVANGTIEIDTMTFRPHSPNDLLTKISAVEFNPNAVAPTWDNFISRIFQDADGSPRSEIIQYIQKAVGYSMTADISAQCLFVLFGGGRNGKTTFMDAIRNIMGDYAMGGLQTLLLKLGDGNGRNSDDEASLFGARLVSVSETDEGQRMDESKVKKLVGGGRITAMRKYEHQFSFDPTHKLWLDCNYKPRVKGNDEGIWRRIKLIPFLVAIPPSERDEHLGDKLKLEASGILNWALQGLSAWLADGRKLNEPREISEAVNGYRSDSDAFGNFLSECVEPNDAERTAVGDAYAAYQIWANENGQQFKMSKIEFGRRMNERGYLSKSSNGTRYFVGCSLLRGDRFNYEKAPEAPAF